MWEPMFLAISVVVPNTLVPPDSDWMKYRALKHYRYFESVFIHWKSVSVLYLDLIIAFIGENPSGRNENYRFLPILLRMWPVKFFLANYALRDLRALSVSPKSAHFPYYPNSIILENISGAMRRLV